MTNETSEATKLLHEWTEAGKGRKWAMRHVFHDNAFSVSLEWSNGRDCGSSYAIRANPEEAAYAALYDYAEQTINRLQARVKELEDRQTKQAELFMDAMRERDEARTELSRSKAYFLFCIGTGRFGESYERSYVWIESGAKEVERAVEAFKAKYPDTKANSVQRLFDSDCQPFVSALSDSGFDFI